MPNFLRPQTFPYAASSTGQFRGLLVRKYPCWEAQGPARDIFTREIASKIKECLEHWLPESNSFIGFSLFMVGKLPQKTKPTIMIVSDDKPRRKEAFRIVKTRNIMSSYPGFELGHCSVAAEFEDLKQLGSGAGRSLFSSEQESHHHALEDLFGDSKPEAELVNILSTEVFAMEYPRVAEPTRLYFNVSQRSKTHSVASATCGGLFKYRGEFYAITMAHAIHGNTHSASTAPKPQSDSSSHSDDDFEIAGMEEWDEIDDDDDGGDFQTITAVTSIGSKTTTDFSDSEEGFLKRQDGQLSPEKWTRPRSDTEMHIACDEDSVMHDRDYDDNNQNVINDFPDSTQDENQDGNQKEDEYDMLDLCKRVGFVVSVDQALDIAVIKLSPDLSQAYSFFTHPGDAIEIERYLASTLGRGDPIDTSVTIKTTHHSMIRGQRSRTPFYTLLPSTSKFLDLFSAKLSAPICHGDSGSWALNNAGELEGFVVAGNPKTGSCLLLPARSALESIRSLLSSRTIKPLSRSDVLGLFSKEEQDATVTTRSLQLSFTTPGHYGNPEMPAPVAPPSEATSHKRKLREDAGAESIDHMDFRKGLDQEDKRFIETAKTRWQDQVSTTMRLNEEIQRLNQENASLRYGITETIRELKRVNNERRSQAGGDGFLSKIISDLTTIHDGEYVYTPWYAQAPAVAEAEQNPNNSSKTIRSDKTPMPPSTPRQTAMSRVTGPSSFIQTPDTSPQMGDATRGRINYMSDLAETIRSHYVPSENKQPTPKRRKRRDSSISATTEAALVEAVVAVEKEVAATSTASKGKGKDKSPVIIVID